MIVLDTHVLIWWASSNESQISQAANRTIKLEQKKGKIFISSITAWEIVMLVARDRLTLSIDVSKWLNIIENTSNIEFIPVNNEIAINSINLPGTFHKDPADRIIVATAKTLGATLITADEKIHRYNHVKIIW